MTIQTFNLHKVIKRGLRLLKEAGSTGRSIYNFNILSKNFELVRMTMYYADSSSVRIHTEWIGGTSYTDILFSWEFTGLSAGYTGEGSRGFKEVLDKMNEMGYENTFNPFEYIKDNVRVRIY